MLGPALACDARSDAVRCRAASRAALLGAGIAHVQMLLSWLVGEFLGNTASYNFIGNLYMLAARILLAVVQAAGVRRF